MIRILLFLSIVCAYLPAVRGHGKLVSPEAEFVGAVLGGTWGWDNNQFSATMWGKTVFPNGRFDYTPESNQQNFAEQFANSQYPSLKALIEANQDIKVEATADCGFTKPTKKVTLGSTVWWGTGPILTGPNSNAIGFTESHYGPCEAWCDNEKVLYHPNCVEFNRPNQEAEVPIEVSKCGGASRFQFYWLALHSSEWQVYINCLDLVPSTKTPSPTTKQPTTTPPPTTTTKVPTTTPLPTTTPTPTPPQTTSGIRGLACNYEGKYYAICRLANAWSYENGVVCVGITRCVSQSPPYGVVTLK